MNPIWQKVTELCQGWAPESDVSQVYDLVHEAWRMGFDVVRQPKGGNLFNDAMSKIYDEQRNMQGPGPYRMDQLMNTRR